MARGRAALALLGVLVGAALCVCEATRPAAPVNTRRRGLAITGRSRTAFLGLPPQLSLLLSGLTSGLTMPEVVPPWYYGKYCGPTPEISVETNCRHPLNLKPIDKADEVCYLHDRGYCECDRQYIKAGKRPPPSAVMAVRSAVPPYLKEAFLQSLDQQYYKCIHEADKKLLGRYEALVSRGELPLQQWDPIVRFKFFAFLEIFRRDMALDRALLDLPPDDAQEVQWMVMTASDSLLSDDSSSPNSQPITTSPTTATR